MQSLDVGAWLEELGLGQYRALFSDQAIDSDVLPDLTDDDLVRLGVPLGSRSHLSNLCERGRTLRDDS